MNDLEIFECAEFEKELEYKTFANTTYAKDTCETPLSYSLCDNSDDCNTLTNPTPILCNQGWNVASSLTIA